MALSEGFTERVLSLVEQIPSGRVLSYGIIAEIIDEGGPRQVGHVMAMDGGGVPWWRVVHADGSLPRCHEDGAIDYYRAEKTPMRASGKAIDIRKALWDGPFEVD